MLKSPWIWRYLAGSLRYSAAKLKNWGEKGPFSAKLDQFSVLWQSVPLRDRAFCSKNLLFVLKCTTKVPLSVWQSINPFGFYRRISGSFFQIEIKILAICPFKRYSILLKTLFVRFEVCYKSPFDHLTICPSVRMLKTDIRFCPPHRRLCTQIKIVCAYKINLKSCQSFRPWEKLSIDVCKVSVWWKLREISSIL